ncbi:hypothetical protein FSP39_006719 [Pinctada imbricata]|uniref:RNA-directed DNA polymerase n=2 Tax=Pinctada imbricata TaxID=66713 RepID=A0AA88XEP2_PINIB|nr:hypothetical protein FSP39_006719 [Pinctada imbricata]
MKGYLLEPIKLEISGNVYKESIYVAPLEDAMLIGLDFMSKYQTTLDMNEGYLCIRGKRVPFIDKGNNSVLAVNKTHIRIPKKTHIPPRSVLRISCITDKKLENGLYLTKPEVNTVLAPRICFEGASTPVMSFVNNSNNKVTLFKNQKVGYAYEVDEIPPVADLTGSLHISQVTKEQGKQGTVPEHLTDLYQRSCSELDENQQVTLENLLNSYADVFSAHEYDIGNFTAIEHGIDTGDARPIKQRFRRTPTCFAGEEEKHLEKMLTADVIEPSVSEWASSPVLVRKRDGSVRWCVDYRALNKVTKKDVFPLPLVEECMDTLSGNLWYSKLDATWGYWQIKVKDEDKCKTAFTTKYGLYQFKRMSFGLTNAPSTFSRVMNLVLRGLHWKTVLAFLDDVLVLGHDFEDHIENLSEVFARFRQYGIKLKAKKCDLFRQEVEYLGRTVGRDGMKVSQSFIDTMNKWTTPTCTKDVERFCGFANYHRNFIKNVAYIAAPLYGLTGKNKFHWEVEHQEAFEQLKSALTTAPVLTIPTKDGHFILDTDASDIAIGAELIQIQNGEERSISFCSFSLTPEQRRYCTTKKELLAVIRFTRHFRHYLLGRQFDVRTDHSSLQWLMNFKNPNGQLARWLEELSQYWMVIRHRPGIKHQNADALSRLPDVANSNYSCQEFRHYVQPNDLPCGGCDHCQRKHREWSHFIETVDDAVPLANYMVKQVKQTAPLSWMESYTWSEVKEYQRNDRDLKFILNWLTNQEEPSDIFLSNPAAKNYWVNRELYFLCEDGILWKKDPIDDSIKLPVVPTTLREEILKLCHDLPSSGHQGQDRTLGRCQQRFHWYSMGKDVKSYVISCSHCNRNKKPNRKARCRFTSYYAGSPMERVHLDFLGPLPMTKNNNSFVLMMVDQFTKWVECVPLPNQTAEVTAQAAVDHFFSRFGIPFQIFTDRGSNFESTLFKQLCERMAIHKARTTAFRPSANDQVERYNSTLMDAVRCFSSRTPKYWDVYLPQLASALRSAINRSTGYTPNMLMLGRDVNMPVDLIFPGPEPSEKEDYEDYVNKLVVQIQSAHEIAREKLKSGQAIAKRDYDLKVHEHTYSVGDVVYISDTAIPKGKCAKLRPQWKGPGLVTRKITDYVYKVMLRKKLEIINHDRMKHCSDRVLPAWLKRQKKSLKDGSPLRLSESSNSSKYCLCKGPDTGEFMIQCDECREWYHESCVGIGSDKAKDIDVYLCPDCDVSCSY